MSNSCWIICLHSRQVLPFCSLVVGRSPCQERKALEASPTHSQASRFVYDLSVLRV